MCQINWIKTFDRFDWDFVFSALQKFHYGDKFIHLIKFVFTKIQPKFDINIPLTEPFTLMCGILQGCSLSMLLYIYAAEEIQI